jgi:glucosylceramidase
MIQSIQYGATAAMLYNLALDEHYGPTINTSCGYPGTSKSHCLPLLSVDGRGGDVEKQVGYYTLGQLSEFVQPGASHIESTLGAVHCQAASVGMYTPTSCGLWSVAFENTVANGGDIVMEVLNKTVVTQTFNIAWDGYTLSAQKLAPDSVATYVWSPAAAEATAARSVARRASTTVPTTRRSRG